MPKSKDKSSCDATGSITENSKRQRRRSDTNDCIEKTKQFATKPKKAISKRLSVPKTLPKPRSYYKFAPSLLDLEKMYEDDCIPLDLDVDKKFPSEILHVESSSSAEMANITANTADDCIVVNCTPAENFSDNDICINYNFQNRILGKTKNEENECDESMIPVKRVKYSENCGNESSNNENGSDNIESQNFIKDTNEDSSDSTKTISYFCKTSNFDNIVPPRTFSPLPSTSKDNETYLENVKRLNESNSFGNGSLMDIEVDEKMFHIQIVDHLDEGNSKTDKSEAIIKNNSKFHIFDMTTINLCDSFDNSDCEIIDVDKVIAENEAIIDKYKVNNFNTVTNISGTEDELKKRDSTNVTLQNVSFIDLTKPCQCISVKNSSIGHRSTIVNNFKRSTDSLPDSCQIPSLQLNNNKVFLTMLSTQTQVNENYGQLDSSIFNNIHNRSKITNKQIPAEFVAQKDISMSTEPHRRIGDCPICMENLATKDIASTICGHIFCMKCIQLATKGRYKRCPTCRKVLKGVGFHQIFI